MVIARISDSMFKLLTATVAILALAILVECRAVRQVESG